MRIKKALLMLCMAVAMTIAIPTIETNVGNMSTVEAASKVKINKKKVTLYEGKTTTLKVKGTKKKVKWTSNKKSVATVSSKGKVKAKKKGTATITAKVGKKKYKCKVTVKAKKKAVPAISVNTQDITIKDSGRIYVTYNDTKALVYGNVSDTSVISASWHPTYQVGNTRAIDIVALKNGVSYIELTNNIDSTKITIKVTVSGHVEPIQYIGDRSVDYDSIEKEQRLFFAFKTANQTRVAASGVANIKIVNDDGVEVYNKAVSFNQNNFANWTSASYGTRYLCCIKIPDTELIKSTATSGKLTFSVVLNDSTSFSESTYNISNLPVVDYTSLCTLVFNDESKISYGYATNIAQFYDVQYQFTSSNDPTKVDLKITYMAKRYQKTYDHLFYNTKLKKTDSNMVIKTGTYEISDLDEGEVIQKSVTYYGLEPGSYTFLFEGSN